MWSMRNDAEWLRYSPKLQTNDYYITWDFYLIHSRNATRWALISLHTAFRTFEALSRASG